MCKGVKDFMPKTKMKTATVKEYFISMKNKIKKRTWSCDDPYILHAVNIVNFVLDGGAIITEDQYGLGNWNKMERTNIVAMRNDENGIVKQYKEI